MSLEAGALSKGFIGSFSAQVQSLPATGGTGPYTYQWYRDSSSGFTPGGGNILTGKTALNIVDDTVLPGTTYYYKVVVTDTGHSNDTDESDALEVNTEVGTQAMNSFAQNPIQGMLDLKFNPDTITVQIDEDASTALYASQPVKFIQDAGGVPKVEAATSDDDDIAGFLTYDVKSKTFPALAYAEMSMDQNVMYLVSTAAIARGEKVMIDESTIGGVLPVTDGKSIVGFALDVAEGAGQLIRIKLQTPSVIYTAPSP